MKAEIGQKFIKRNLPNPMVGGFDELIIEKEGSAEYYDYDDANYRANNQRNNYSLPPVVTKFGYFCKVHIESIGGLRTGYWKTIHMETKALFENYKPDKKKIG